jgi:hypothetical protein
MPSQIWNICFVFVHFGQLGLGVMGYLYKSQCKRPDGEGSGSNPYTDTEGKPGSDGGNNGPVLYGNTEKALGC